MALPTFTLNNGLEIPVLGFGPMIAGYGQRLNRSRNIFVRAYNKLIARPRIKSEYISAVRNAFEIGFNLLDFSESYGNQEYVAEALRKSGVDRRNVFITARLSNHTQIEGGGA